MKWILFQITWVDLIPLLCFCSPPPYHHALSKQWLGYLAMAAACKVTDLLPMKRQVFPDFTAKCVSYAICDLFCICSWTVGLAQDVQWDKPGTVIAQMTTELSELFTREMTRVSATLHFAELLWFIRLLFRLLCPGLNKNMQFVVLHWEISFSGWKCCWGYACAVHWWDRRSGHGGITKQWAHSKETHWWASCQDKDQWICESCFLFLLCNWKVVCKGFSFGLG